MECGCKIHVAFPDEKRLDAAAQALSHEGGLSKRSSARTERNGRTLTISIEAKDIIALRATTNAFLRAVQAFEGVEEGASEADK